MVSGRLDRHPGLKIGLIESGAGWVPFAIEALEHQFDEMLADKRDVLKKRPWQYFADHFWCTFWLEKVAPKLLLEILVESTRTTAMLFAILIGAMIFTRPKSTSLINPLGVILRLLGLI